MKELKHAYKDGWIDSFNNQEHNAESFALDWEASLTKNQPSVLLSKLEELMDRCDKTAREVWTIEDYMGGYGDIVCSIDNLIDENSND